MKAKDLIEKYKGCKEAIEWAGDMTVQEAWETCHRGDWMLLVYSKIYKNLRELTLAKGHCANTIRHLLSDERSKEAIDVAIAFGMGEATKDELKAAADSAYAAACAAADSAAAAACAAADSAAAAEAAAYSAADSASAAEAAAFSAYAAAFSSAYISASCAASTAYSAAATCADAAAAASDRLKNQQQTADICREFLTPTMEKLWNH